ncbi:MAG: UDP-N-acetylmuramoyl-tripeptide--D-alanyl-D-alanine ligase [Microthrixaceae bacterium]
MQVPLSALLEPLNAALSGPDVEIRRVVVDSRQAGPGDLFVPLLAERDGHEFIASALAAGASASLSARPVADLGLHDSSSVVVVADTARALDDLGRLARSRTTARVIGVTGSVGKTTVKDLAASVLATTLSTSASERSFNNEIGVPLTLANAPETAEALVVEMGARGPGHIAALCRLARPEVGVATVVAGAHLECFGDLEGVAAAKGELIESLPSSGTAVLNADDHRVAAMASRTDARVLTFGRTGGDVRASEVSLGDDLCARFRLDSPWGSVRIRLSVAGEHQVTNALAAAAIGLDAGVTPTAVSCGLADAAMSPWRMELVSTPGGASVINDAYNANPTSTEAALAALAELPARRRVALLGEMAELGTDAQRLHHEIAGVADRLGLELVAVGTNAYGVAATSADDAASLLEALGPGEAALVKASRVAGLERLVQRVVAGPGSRGE